MASLLVRLQSSVAGRYTVEQELGRGGMATVFLGKDLKLDRRVAIKVYERDSGVITTGERFLREIRIAAQLQHPNILPVHDSGEGADLVYYVMPYVASGSVRERLEREGPLPIGDAIRIAREVAEALDHAHRAGIVHRDIKPDNIMLADGVAVVADFGIARAIEEGGAGRVTETGLAVGTPTYMSPEQAAAQPQVDGRTDLYALGCVLYEMLTGSPPFSGATGQQVMARHATDPVPPIGTVRPIPASLEAVVTKALAKLPADRFATGRTMAEALALATPTTSTLPVQRRSRAPMWIGVAAGAMIAAFAAWKFSAGRGIVSAAEAPITSIAVLPIASLGDTALTKYADGMTEALASGLIRIPGLSIPDPSRSARYRDRQSDLAAVGRDLGATALLVGSLQKSGRELRLTVRLINAADGLVRWSHDFDGLEDQVFSMQDSVTVGLADALRLNLGTQVRASLARGELTRDTSAYRLFLEARQVMKTAGPEAARRGAELVRTALQKDSSFANAWLQLAAARQRMANSDGTTPLELSRELRNYVDRALTFDGENIDALQQRALMYQQNDWNWDLAHADYAKAVRLAPASAELMAEYSWHLTFLTQRDSALHYARRAVALDQKSGWAWAVLGFRLFERGVVDSAILATEQAGVLEPGLRFQYPEVLLMGYAATNRHDDANRLAEEVSKSVMGSVPLVKAILIRYHLRAGNLERVRQLAGEISAIASKRYISPGYQAVAKLALGDTTGALSLLEQGVAVGDTQLPKAIALYPWPRSGNPRFEAVKQKVFGDRPLPAPIY